MIKITFIETPGHGYYAVKKTDLVKINYPVEQITRFSGHDLSRVYFEEDCDASELVSFLRGKGIIYSVKNTYRNSFSITHNYNVKYFSWRPSVGYVFHIGGVRYTISHMDKKGVYVQNGNKRSYRIPLSNLFRYIHE